jgi:ABC-type polysaccharide/polyol phosphate export permease
MAFPNKLQKTINDIELIRTLTINSLKIKYKRSKLGLSWSLLNPVINITVIAFVFSHIMGMAYSQFAIFFFSGYLAWGLFSSSFVSASNCLISNESLIKKVPINLMIFPLVTVSVHIVEFMLALIVLGMLLLLLGLKISFAILFLPISFLLLLLFTVGVAFIASVMTAFFRDCAHIFAVVVQLWFYLTPVLYPKTFLSGKREILRYLNPMVSYIDLFRAPIFYMTMPSWQEISVAVVLSISVFTLGVMVFNKFRSRIIFNL